MVLAFNTPTDRLMSRIAITIFSLGALYGVYSFGRPLYWRFYATVWRPFEDVALSSGIKTLDYDPFSAAVMEKEEQLKKELANKTTAVPKIKKPFDINDYPLTKERVHGLLQDGYIMVTWANHHYLDFAKNWVYHVKKAGVTGYIVGAMDDDILKELADLEYNTWRMNSGIVKHDLGWGSPNFHKMGRVKISLIKEFLLLDVVVLISDIDTAWLQNPMPYFNRFPEAHILTSTDQLRETVSDDSLELFPEAGASFNIGIMMFRQASMAFVDDWIKKLEDPKMWDQTAFNDLVRLGATHSDRGMKNLWKGDNGKLVVGVLPASIFASGHMFFVQRKFQELGLKPYVAHATFQYSGTPGKRNRFRELLYWDDPPEYFDHPKGFIHLKIDIPKDMWEKSKGIQGIMLAPALVNHMKLVHYQLLRLRAGLLLATLTGRVLVMPPIWCEIDKYWAPLFDGNIPGSRFKKPFICPMDHVLDIEASWNRPMDVNAAGPHIEWKEYSFFENPRLTPAVNKSRLVAHACTGDCEGGTKVSPVKDAKVGVAAGVDVEKLKEALTSPQALSYKVLEVSSGALDVLLPAWLTLPAPEKDKFMHRLRHYPSVVCCLQDNPGWVWYDLMNDIQHEDRFGRKFSGDKLKFFKGDSPAVAFEET